MPCKKKQVSSFCRQITLFLPLSDTLIGCKTEKGTQVAIINTMK